MEIEEFNALTEFVKDYIKSNTYISPRGLALVYGKCGSRGEPSKNLIRKFGKIIGILRRNGLVERFNTRVYVKRS